MQRSTLGFVLGGIVFAIGSVGCDGSDPARGMSGAGGAGAGGSTPGQAGDRPLTGTIIYRDVEDGPFPTYRDWYALDLSTRHRELISHGTPILAPIDAGHAIVVTSSDESATFSLEDLKAATTRPLFLPGRYFDDVKPRVSPDGSTFAFWLPDEASRNHVERVRLDALLALPMPPQGAALLDVPGLATFDDYVDASWAPEGALFLAGPSSLAVVANGTPTTFLDHIDNPSAPTFSPDGQRLAFIMSAGATQSPTATQSTPQIYVVNRDGSGLKPLTNTDLVFESLSWGPDPELLVACHRTIDTNDHMVLVRMDGSLAPVLDEFGYDMRIQADRVFWRN